MYTYEYGTYLPRQSAINGEEINTEFSLSNVLFKRQTP